MPTINGVKSCNNCGQTHCKGIAHMGPCDHYKNPEQFKGSTLSKIMCSGDVKKVGMLVDVLTKYKVQLQSLI
jgi:hypothetical protein